MMERIAIILLNYNSTSDCRRCIQDIKRQKGVGIRVIVVDNNSRIEERHAAEALCAEENAVFLTSPVNRGYSAGNNIGLRYAVQEGFEVIAICNPDMLFSDEECISKCLHMIKSDPEIALLGPDIVLSDGVTHHNPQKDGPFDFWSVFLSPCRLFKDILLRRQPQPIGEPDWENSRFCRRVSGCFFLIRSSFLSRIGYLDENTFLYGEESILAAQLRKEGLKAYYLAEAHAIHNHANWGKGNPCKNIKYLQKSELYFYCNYCGFSRWQVFWIIVSRKIGNLIHNFLLWLKYHKSS